VKRAVKARRKRAASAKKPPRLPEFTAKRYAALLTYMENSYPRPKNLKELAKQVQLDAIALSKIQKAGNSPTIAEQMAKGEDVG